MHTTKKARNACDASDVQGSREREARGSVRRKHAEPPEGPITPMGFYFLFFNFLVRITEMRAWAGHGEAFKRRRRGETEGGQACMQATFLTGTKDLCFWPFCEKAQHVSLRVTKQKRCTWDSLVERAATPPPPPREHPRIFWVVVARVVVMVRCATWAVLCACAGVCAGVQRQQAFGLPDSV